MILECIQFRIESLNAQTPRSFIGTWDQKAPDAPGYETGKVVGRFVKEPIINAGSSVAKAGTTSGRAVLKTAVSIATAMARKTKKAGGVVLRGGKKTRSKILAMYKNRVHQAEK